MFSRTPLRRFFRPRIELLEGRQLPSVFMVTNTNDFGSGSLRQAILDANSHPGTDTIAFNIGGGVQTIQPRSVLPTITDPVVIDGTTQPGFAGTPLIVLNGSQAGAGATGLTITAGYSTVQALVINGFAADGINLLTNGSDNISGNFLGTDATGSRTVANGGNGLFITSGNNRVGGMMAGVRNLISGNRQDGIRLSGSTATANLVQGDFIGTDVTGQHGLGNGPSGSEGLGSGVVIVNAPANTIGGTAANARNVISGNLGDGVYIGSGSGNLVASNYLGTDATGTVALGNENGVEVFNSSANTIGGTAAAAGNLISGNSASAVALDGTSSGNSVQGNRIGTDVAGTAALGNGYGVVISYGSNNLIGGTAAGAGNLISGSRVIGIWIANSAAQFNTIQGNQIGTDLGGTKALGNGTGIEIQGGSGTLIGGTSAAARNLISGNGTGELLAFPTGTTTQGNYIGTDATGTKAVPNGIGIQVLYPRSELIGGTVAGAGNVISGNSGDGINVGDTGSSTVRVTIQGNYIGTDATGTKALGNARGVEIGHHPTQIGGTVPGARNLISGNTGTGVDLPDTLESFVQGNYIGTDVFGTKALGNGIGVSVSGYTHLIGGTAVGDGNLISGNVGAGVIVSGNYNVVQGNRIGTDVTGTMALGNDTGVSVSGLGNTIGGTVATVRNVISGNHTVGLRITGGNAQGNIIEGNFIGTDVNGTTPLPNAGGGVIISGSSNTVGGTITGAENLISGNQKIGVSFSASGGLAPSNNLIAGNFIGTDLTGHVPVGNGIGIYIYAGMNNTIGGTVESARNLIAGNRETGIFIAGQSNIVEGNFIGTDATGTIALSNNSGVSLTPEATDNVIGGTVSGARNIISGNINDGIGIAGIENLIQGNYIGTDVTGNAALPNDFGVDITGGMSNTIGGTVAGAGNLISGNSYYGVDIVGNNNTVQGNYIGTDVVGMVALPNEDGVFCYAGLNNVIGGAVAGARNLISGNTDDGIEIQGNASTEYLVQGNYIGTDITGKILLPNGGDGVRLQQVSGNTIGGTPAGAGNLIAGNSGDGINITGGTGNLIQGNWIGTDVTGSAALGNGGNGVSISTSANTIGGTVAGAGNLISGNQMSGVFLIGSGATGNLVLGNYIGTDITGTAALGNGFDGVRLVTLASNNTIGGPAAGAGNLISGNTTPNQYGIDIDGGAALNLVQGNYIGTDVTGTLPLGNFRGIHIGNAPDNTIGGPAAGAGNVISANIGSGMLLDGADGTGTLVQGNLIGTDSTGTVALGNGGDGIHLFAAVANTTIGGTAAGAGNLIAGNVGSGIHLERGAMATFIQGNLLGTDTTGTLPIGNGMDGVLIGDAFDNQVGGTAPAAGNTIAFNGQDGILVDTGTGNTILRNRIFGHDNGLGVELLNGGNDDQPFPTLSSATFDGTFTTIRGTLASAPDTTYTIEIFVNTICNPSGFGEGEQFFASLTVATDDAGNASFSLSVPIAIDPGQFISATATDPNGNTSEFAACAEVTGPEFAAIEVGSDSGITNRASRMLLRTAEVSTKPAYPGEHDAVPEVAPLPESIDLFFAGLQQRQHDWLAAELSNLGGSIWSPG